ncbi:pyridoxamine 5'-phosphate oxidase [Sinimarinibacterium thermocellulolyticum]|uniref:Pyridoxine/pyridoxamine 5'-phosphate oxidase n=1 Tax=Sinimarinibacterium thermocellulolyticum TaxID=3170016 RepID=A0ABV2A9N2_9GAMM
MAQYTKNPPLLEAALAADPLIQLDRWLGDAQAAGMIEPTAMTLATVDAQGRPSARMVLFKGVHNGALTFYTNHESRKGRELAANPRVALVFWWDRLERQVRVEGMAQRLPVEVARRYFYTRPRESQIGALISRQSAIVADRATLDRRYDETVARLAGADVPYPEHWGGYGVTPQCVEFWQGRSGRLHDRLCYQRAGDGWRIDRLEP